MPDPSILHSRIQNSLQTARSRAARLHKQQTGLTATSIVASAASTLVAGVTAANGPLAGAGVEGWRAACIIAAVLSFITTVAISLEQQLKLSDRISKANECLGRLQALELAAAAQNRPPEEISGEYEKVLQAYPGL